MLLSGVSNSVYYSELMIDSSSKVIVYKGTIDSPELYLKCAVCGKKFSKNDTFYTVFFTEFIYNRLHSTFYVCSEECASLKCLEVL